MRTRARTVEQVFDRVVERIVDLLMHPENTPFQEWFDTFHTELRSSINDGITRSCTINMMTQHILSRPVFEALFENYDFASGNPITRALDYLLNNFRVFEIENVTRDLEDFYENIRFRARSINNIADRQRLLSELYEEFFKKIINQDTDKIGILFTPIEIVDFMLHSVNEILQDEFERRLTNEGVHVLDPFTGSGTFLSRLIQSGLIRPDDLERKYREELHANEIVPFAYYLASVNIEDAFHGQRGENSSYEPFNSIVLTDTFNLNIEEAPTLFPRESLVNHNKRVEKQQTLPIQVIVGNPPWSVGYRIGDVDYTNLEDRIRDTYAAYSVGPMRHRLYDTYKMAFRWASDRIHGQGIIAFVTNGSWINSSVDSGVRACLAMEFSSIHVFNLHGNTREDENVFGSSFRAPVTITILVKNPNTLSDDCIIHYRHIGYYLTREQKLKALREAISIKGFSDWRTISPQRHDRHSNWIQQRSEVFKQFYPLASQSSWWADGTSDAIFNLYSRGIRTSRDTYIHNFSREACAQNAQRMIQHYLIALSELEANPDLIENVETRRNAFNFRWDQEIENNLRQRRTTEFNESNIRKIAYSHFIKMNCYVDNIFIQTRHEMARMFPSSSSVNSVICIPRNVSSSPFSALMTDTLPTSLFFRNGCECFPRYQYSEMPDRPGTTDTFQSSDEVLYRIDNISDSALSAFCRHYGTNKITKDEIFYYVYGILHSPSYRDQFATDLRMFLPRIPFAPDFIAFADAGMRLASLHLNYETCQQYPLNTVLERGVEPQPEHFRIGPRGMQFAYPDRRTLTINEHVRLFGIPEDAHRYVVSHKTPLEWFINCYKITRDRDSGIRNDANGWFENPRDLITAIERIVYVSVESARIIDKLPAELTAD